MAFPQTKAELRKIFAGKRKKNIPAEAVLQAAVLIEKICAWEPFSSAECAAVYVSFGAEFPTRELIRRALASGKIVCVPRVDGENLRLFKIRVPEKDLEPGAFGILEPKKSCEEIPAAFPKIHIVPALAFDLCGNRLGYGKGFYDRFLKSVPAETVKLVVGYDFQLTEILPAEKTDVPATHFATPARGIVPASGTRAG